MMIIQILAAVLLAAVPLLAVLFAYSFIRTRGGTRYSLAFHEKDRYGQPGTLIQRQYRGVSHFFIRLADMLRYLYPLLLVYVFRIISPGFREKIMITTAIANSCPQ